METMGVMSQEVTDTPMPSAMMPASTMKKSSTTVIAMLPADEVISVR